MPITQIAADDHLKSAWHKVFKSTDPFIQPFSPAMEAVLAFYRTDGYFLSEPQFNALTAALNASGYPLNFYISHTESSNFFASGEHWWGEFPTYEEYAATELLPLENALYSPHGGWGCIISHEDHALIGGSRRFIRSMREAYPGWRNDLVELRRFWEGNKNGGWLMGPDLEMSLGDEKK